jgi:sialidase-1
MQFLDRVPLYESGVGGYARYRIPALLTTATGTILAFCEARKHTGSDADQIDLFLRRSFDHGKTFTDAQVVTTAPGWVSGNPAPVQDRETGRIWLLFCRSLEHGDERMICAGTAPRTVWVTASDDDGASWSQPVEITDAVKRPEWTWYATGPGHGIQTTAGRLVIPCDHIVGERMERFDPYYSHVIYSDDHGEHWQIGGSADLDTNECTIVEARDQRLCLNCRNKLGSGAGGAYRAVCWSDDGGQSFGPVVHDAALPEPVCQAAICRFPDSDGRSRVLFSNPASRAARRSMTLQLSYDDCRTWPVHRLLHAGPAAYSDICVAGDANVLCLYEASAAGAESPYATLTLARFNLEWLTAGADTGGRSGSGSSR